MTPASFFSAPRTPQRSRRSDCRHCSHSLTFRTFNLTQSTRHAVASSIPSSAATPAVPLEANIGSHAFVFSSSHALRHEARASSRRFVGHSSQCGKKCDHHMGDNAWRNTLVVMGLHCPGARWYFARPIPAPRWGPIVIVATRVHSKETGPTAATLALRTSCVDVCAASNKSTKHGRHIQNMHLRAKVGRSYVVTIANAQCAIWISRDTLCRCSSSSSSSS